jgi:glycosyltransferase involved in cell wall biosynthesis
MVSVIIPVFQDEAGLRRCLSALERQTYPKERYEVVVVNNDSSQTLHLEGLPSNVRIVEEATVGSYAARNKGIAVSRGDILAFTDADCAPEDDWLERGVAQLQQHPDAGLVGGQMALVFQNGEPRNSAERLDDVIAFPQEIFIKHVHFSATGNLFTFRAVIQKIGPFNASMKSAGDKEWGQRVHSAGYPLYYAEDVRIRHPALDSTRRYIKKMKRLAGGLADLQLQKGQTSFRALAVGVASDFFLFFIYLRMVLAAQRPSGWQKLGMFPLMLLLLGVAVCEHIRVHVGGVSGRA